MAYLTRDEYLEQAHATEASLPDNFDDILDRASDYLDQITSDYYVYHDLESDRFTLRATRFKRALVRQIQYMINAGVTSQDDFERQATSISQTIGKTAISRNYSSNGTTASGETANSIISADTLSALRGTGLLNGGIGYVQTGTQLASRRGGFDPSDLD